MPASARLSRPAWAAARYAAEPAREIDPGRDEVTRTGSGVAAGEIRCLLDAKAGRQHQRDGGLGCSGDGLQLFHVVLIEWVGASAVDQHGSRRTGACQRLRDADRIRRHDEGKAEQTCIGCELLSRARALAIGGDHGRGGAAEYRRALPSERW